MTMAYALYGLVRGHAVSVVVLVGKIPAVGWSTWLLAALPPACISTSAARARLVVGIVARVRAEFRNLGGIMFLALWLCWGAG